VSDVFERLDALAAEGDLDAVERLAEASVDAAAPEDVCDLWRYVAWARFEKGRFPDALEAARQACDPLYEAKVLFHRWDFEGAQEALDRFEGAGEDAAEAAWYQGCLCEFRGEDPAEHFRAACGLAPHLFAPPARLSDAEVDAVVQSAIAALPAALQQAIQDTVIQVAPLPRPHADVDPLTLGLYHGVSRLERSHFEPTHLPPSIVVYRLNVERIAADRETAVDELRITLLHELAHHLGFDERGVEDLGLA
jgi:predicted Zn-dependent protease with MMP-like domain